jgi:hypothetical protein
MKLIEALDEVAQRWGLKNFQQLSLQGRPDLTQFIESVERLYLESRLQELEKGDQEELIDEIIIIYSKWANNGDVDNAEQKAFDELKSKFIITRRD